MSISFIHNSFLSSSYSPDCSFHLIPSFVFGCFWRCHLEFFVVVLNCVSHINTFSQCWTFSILTERPARLQNTILAVWPAAAAVLLYVFFPPKFHGRGTRGVNSMQQPPKQFVRDGQRRLEFYGKSLYAGNGIKIQYFDYCLGFDTFENSPSLQPHHWLN